MGFVRRSACLPLVGLPEACGLALVAHQLPRGADGLHFDRFVFGRIADDDAKLATFTAINRDFCDHLGDVEIQAVGLRAIHDAQSTALLGHALLVDNLRYVIHATWFLLSR